MIRYTLRCARGHEFDSWFGSAAAYDALAAAGHLGCAVCGSAEVGKSVMAPRLGGDARDAAAPDTGPQEAQRPLSAAPTPRERALADLRRHIEATSEDVGRNFVHEARAMHLGDAPDRPIRGEATFEEARGLAEDGIPVAPLPFRPDRKSN
ncbi:DUF1178 family protein [Roseivivax sediminis]|uniref:DUF1178 family protein n=1 Tax=Roseivivax sediminis TaxID=936889 RepID=A0A1I1WD29_9RHOB|nr:DUF1178 family protein [Roseivivax sediminis]SFD93057.1 hypothetical protein SAMN04515678_104257 [Roseivivax sediminis]